MEESYTNMEYVINVHQLLNNSKVYPPVHLTTTLSLHCCFSIFKTLVKFSIFQTLAPANFVQTYVFFATNVGDGCLNK